MACGKYNKGYRSAVEFVNTTPQTVAATNTVLNPISLNLGNRVTRTGCSLQIEGNTVLVNHSGLYRISANVNVTGDTAGDVTFAIAVDGNVLPETVSTLTMVQDIAKDVNFETVRPISTCNTFGEHTITIVAYSDATGVGTVNKVSGNVIRLS